jgi:hypothetical protein
LVKLEASPCRLNSLVIAGYRLARRNDDATTTFFGARRDDYPTPSAAHSFGRGSGPAFPRQAMQFVEVEFDRLPASLDPSRLAGRLSSQAR